MAATALSEQKWHTALVCMLSYPALVALMWSASPDNYHWQHTFWCTSVGCVAWVAIVICGVTNRIQPRHAVVLNLEVGFGIVPMLYLILDFHRVGPDCFEQVSKNQVLATVPVVIMAKQLARTVIDIATESEPSTWWHFYIDISEMFFFMVFGVWNAGRDIGRLWLLIYSSTPVFVSGLWLDHMTLRMHTLLRANARLLQTAFAGVIRVGALELGGSVFESSPGFDALIDGDAMGLKLENLFTADRIHLGQLCSPALVNERVVRRVRTSLISTSKAFQQDVELRVLSATQRELQHENGILLGVAIMGERVPFIEHDDSNTSLLLEQSLDEIGQSPFGGGSSPANSVRDHSTENTDIPILSEVGRFDSVSFTGMRKRMNRKVNSACSSSSCTSTIHPAPENPSQTFCKEQGSSKQGLVYGHPWKESNNIEYMKECSLSNLEDLITSWNYRSAYCCHWHDACDRLSALVVEVRRFHSCKDMWPTATPTWQCGACSALQFEESEDGCWLCLTPNDEC